MLATVNLQDWAEKRVSELWGGMQQRVGLARAFATDAEILLMDEPFSALDPLIRNRLQDELLTLQEQMHCTIVFVSHDLEEAVKIGDTITIMEGGRIVQSGTARDIIRDPVSAYVEDFVEHMNPMEVLTAADAGEAGEAPADLGLAATRRPDHQYILGRHFGAQLGGEPLAPPAIAQRHRDGLLGLGLADDMLVQCGDDRLGGQRVIHWIKRSVRPELVEGRITTVSPAPFDRLRTNRFLARRFPRFPPSVGRW